MLDFGHAAEHRQHADAVAAVAVALGAVSHDAAVGCANAPAELLPRIAVDLRLESVCDTDYLLGTTKNSKAAA